jgi:hypothetical protein
MTLEKKIADSLTILGLDYSYKPHPSTKFLPSIPNEKIIDLSVPFESISNNFDLIVFSHFKTTLFGSTLAKNKPMVTFWDPTVEISDKSYNKLCELSGVVNLSIIDEKFEFSHDEFHDQIFQFCK